MQRPALIQPRTSLGNVQKTHPSKRPRCCGGCGTGREWCRALGSSYLFCIETDCTFRGFQEADEADFLVELASRSSPRFQFTASIPYLRNAQRCASLRCPRDDSVCNMLGMTVSLLCEIPKKYYDWIIIHTAIITHEKSSIMV